MFSAAKTAGPSGYNISRSVRLRSSASAYFNRTFTTPTDGKKFTISLWLKRGILGNSGQTILWGNNPWTFALNSVTGTQGSYPSDTLLLWNYGTNTAFASITAAPVLRDPSAWYHIMLVADTAQATASNRILMYINGVNYPTTVSIAQNTALSSAIGHVIGKIEAAATYSDAYLTEYNFIDGQALTPSSFGQSNATTGVWQPKKYSGTYGTNGFYLNFSDNSAATAAAIGKDYSGNGNNWTPNNISVTAGVTYDSMIDVPTPYADGSTNRGNYAVLNPLDNIYSSNTLSNGNLRATTPVGANYGPCKGTFGMSSGKWYWECVDSSGTGSSAAQFGIVQTVTLNDYLSSQPISSAYNGSNGVISKNASTVTTVASFNQGDIIGIALDMDNLTVAFYKNNTLQTTVTALTAGTYFAAGCDATSAGGGYALDFNFGQRPFSYTPPSGYKALNTYNLPSSTITNGGKYMAATTYTGTGASQNITNAGSFKPDLVWIKSRSTVGDTEAYDSVRGATKYLLTDSTVAEGTIAQSLTAFNSNGFALGTGSGGNDNTNGTTYIGWQWQAGQGSTSSNASGSITSTVSVNATAGFSVVTYTGTGANATIGHSLGVAPKMVIVKLRSGAGENWNVWHTSLASTTYRILLNTTGAVDTTSPTIWSSGGINPTSTTFTVGTSAGTNGSGSTYVAYCWAEIAGFSKFGSYTGNGSTDGPFVYTGFRPRWVLWKRSDSVGDWILQDTSRSTYNASDTVLYPNLSAAESVGGGYPFDILSNGFKMRTAASYANANSGTYIYAAFAENPFANALAR